MERLLTTTDVADYLGIPIQTLYQWRSRREGPVGFRVGRHVRYRREDVEAWLEEQRDERTNSRVRAIADAQDEYRRTGTLRELADL